MPETGENFDQKHMDNTVSEPEAEAGETRMQVVRRKLRETAATAWRETKAIGKDALDASIDTGFADELGHGVLRVGAEPARFGLEKLIPDNRKAGLAAAKIVVDNLERRGHSRLSDAMDRLRARRGETIDGAVA